MATSGSVVGSPSSSSAHPDGIGLPQRLAMRSLPKATVVVAMSSTNGAWRPAGAAEEIGVVDSLGARADGGTIAMKAEVVVATPVQALPRGNLQELAGAAEG